MQRQIEETHAEMLSQLFKVRHSNTKQFEIINKNLKRIAMQPVLRPSSMIPDRRRQRLQEEQQSDEEQQSETEVIERMPARLSRCPQILFDLWHEYQFGLSGCKPAKNLVYSREAE